MARRRKIGGMSTTSAVLLGVGGLAVLYLVMKPNTAPAGTLPAGYYPPVATSPSTAAIQAQASTTNTEVNDASSTINNLINSIFS